MSGGASSSSSRRFVEEDAREEYTRQWGDPGTVRGIRGGKRAKRRREAYLSHNPGAPVTRPGGQQRPLGTSRFWVPDQSDEEVDLEVISEDEAVVVDSGSGAADEAVVVESDSGAASSSLSQAIVPVGTWLGPRPKASDLGARAKAKAASGSATVVHKLDSLKFYHPPPRVEVNSDQRPVRPGFPVTLHHTVEAFAWQDQSRVSEIDLTQSRLLFFGDVPVIGLDYHQVLDVDRHSRWSAVRVSESGVLPSRHRRTVTELRDHIERLKSPVKLILVSHIEASERNKRNLLTAVTNSGLSVDLVLITATRVGEGGKLDTLRRLTSGQIIFADDNWEILGELERSDNTIPLQVRKPSAQVVAPREHVCWSISEDWVVERFKTFIAFHARKD